MSVLKAVALDIETTGLHWGAQVLCVSASWRDDNGEVRSASINSGLANLFETPKPHTEVLAWINKMVKDAEAIVFHNASFDIPYLMKMGISWKVFEGRLFDTMAMARWTGGHEAVALKALVDEYGIYQYNHFYERMKGSRSKLSTLDPNDVLMYARMDTEHTLKLFNHLWPKVEEQYSESWARREGDYILEISRMRYRGIKIDVEKIRQAMVQAKKELGLINLILAEHRMFGPNDEKALTRIVGPDYGQLMNRTAKGKVSFDEAGLVRIPMVKTMMEDYKPEEALLRHNDPAVEVAAYTLIARGLQKQISTWYQGFLEQADDAGRVHPLWGAVGTVSYRLNCVEPNAQAVPKFADIWGEEEDYYVLELDFKQAELRLAACYARIPEWAEWFVQGIDIHYGTASKMFGEANAKARRTDAKRANFGGLYGGGAQAIMDATGCTRAEAEAIVTLYRNKFPQIPVISKQAEKRWKQKGYVILAHGKRLWASPEDLKNRIYKAFNQLIQGSIAEIVKEAILRIKVEMPEIQLVAQIHDSLRVLIPKSIGLEKARDMCEQVKNIMSTSCPPEVLNMVDPPVVMEVDGDIEEKVT